MHVNTNEPNPKRTTTTTSLFGMSDQASISASAKGTTTTSVKDLNDYLNDLIAVYCEETEQKRIEEERPFDTIDENDEKEDENNGDESDEEYFYDSSVDENSVQQEIDTGSEDSSNASSFELVFHGIHSVQDITLEGIEDCNSLPDMEYICNALEANIEKRSLRKAAENRLFLLRQQQQWEEEEDEFVVILSNNKKTDVETAKATSKHKAKEDDDCCAATALINNHDSIPNKPHPELTSTILRSAIEMYAKENPEDLGMPMKKLIKFFGIKKKISKQTQDRFQKIVNQQCLLVNTDKNGRVLFLKDSNGDYLGIDDDQETKQTNDHDTNINEDEEDCKMSAVSIQHIQKCTSIKELQEILARLDKTHPRQAAIATARLRVLRETISLNDITASIEDSDDTDDGADPSAPTGVVVSPQTTTENYTEDLDYMLALRLQFEDPFEEAVQNFTASQNEPSSSTPPRSNQPGVPTSADFSCRLQYSVPGSKIAPLSVPQNRHSSPTFYYVDLSVPELRDFWEIPCDIERENCALKYIENCDFIPELRGIVHFASEPENLTPFCFRSSKVCTAAVKRINALRINALSLNATPTTYSFKKKRKNEQKWSVLDSDIQLKRNTKNSNFGQKGNIWLKNLIAENFEFFEKDHRYFNTILLKVEEEGRRFFRLGGDQPSHPRLIWIWKDHKDVREEIFRLFRTERRKRD